MATRNRESSAEWAATITDPITAEKAKERLQYAYDYSSDAINAVMSTLGGTLPPSRELMPGVYDARDKVEAAIEAIGALAERAPQSHVSKTHADLGKQLAMRLIDESNAAMDKSKTGDSAGHVATEIVKSVEHVAEEAGRGLIRIAGLALTPMEALIGAAIVDELFNGGKIRKGLLGGGKRG